MSIHYKFKSTLDFDTITFDGLHISVSDLKKAIIQQKRLGKITDFDLQITNAQTKEEYNEDTALIPKNTSLIIARIPLTHQNKKTWDIGNSVLAKNVSNADGLNLDLSKMNGSEEDKIQAMMLQSTADYDPKSYQKLKGQSQFGEVPASYRCNKCKKSGHWIKNCPLVMGRDTMEGKRNTGIPKSFRENKEKIIATSCTEPVIEIEKKQEVPEDLICGICKDIFTDAVMIPCCGSSFCDDCVRTALLESEDNECPDCKEKGSSPGSLIPNRFLRNSVNAFKNETGYNSKLRAKPVEPPKPKEMDVDKNTPNDVPAPEQMDLPKDVNIEANVENKAPIESVPENNGDNAERSEVTKQTPPHDDAESDFEDNITVTMPPAKSGSYRIMSRERQYNNNRNIRIPKLGPESAPSNPVQAVSAIPSHGDMQRPNVMQNVEWEKDVHGPDMSAMNHRNAMMPTPQMLNSYNMDEMQNHPMRHPNELFLHSVPRMCSYPQMPHHPQIIPGHNMQPHNMNSFDNIFPQMGPRPAMGFQTFTRLPYHNDRAAYMPLRGNCDVRPSVHSDNLDYVYQGVAAKVGTGIIDDPLEAFNRIMKEKEKRKEERRRSMDRRRSRSIERNHRTHRLSPYDHRTKRDTFSKGKTHRSQTRTNRRHYGPEREKSNRRKHSESFSDKSSRSPSRSKSPPRKRSKSPIRRRRSRTPVRAKKPCTAKPFETNPMQTSRYPSKTSSTGQFNERDPKANTKGKSETFSNYARNTRHSDQTNMDMSIEPPPPGFENATLAQDDNPMAGKIAPPEATESSANHMSRSTRHHEKSRHPFSHSSSDMRNESNPNELKSVDKDENHMNIKEKTDKRNDNFNADASPQRSTDMSQKQLRSTREDSTDSKKKDYKAEKRNRDRKRKKERKDKTDRKKMKKEKKRDRNKLSDSIDNRDMDSNHTNTKLSSSTPTRQTGEDDDRKVSEIRASRENERNSKNKDQTVDHSNTQVSIDFSRCQRMDSVLDIHDYDSSDTLCGGVGGNGNGNGNGSKDANNMNLAKVEPSKWENDEQTTISNSKSSSAENADGPTKITSEIIRKAENAIFTRTLNSMRSIEVKKSSVSDKLQKNSDDKMEYPDLNSKSDIKSFQITIPVKESTERSVELKNDVKKDSKLKSIKERLGNKVENESSYRNKSVEESKKVDVKHRQREPDYDSNKKLNSKGVHKDQEVSRRYKVHQRTSHERSDRSRAHNDNSSNFDRNYSNQTGDYYSGHMRERMQNARHGRKGSEKREIGVSVRDGGSKHIKGVNQSVEKRSSKWGTDSAKSTGNNNNSYENNRRSIEGRDYNDSQDNKKKIKSTALDVQEGINKIRSKNPFSSASFSLDMKSYDNNKSRTNVFSTRNVENHSISNNDSDCDGDDQKRKKRHKLKKDKKRIKRSTSLDSSSEKRKHKKRIKKKKKEKK